MKQKIVITKNEQETKKFAEELVRKLHFREGATLALYGELGSGKTTFVQGLAKGLGIKRRIISPTFIIVRTYKLKTQKLFYHIDLYRIEGENDIEGLGLQEILNNKNVVIAVEWAEKMGNLLPSKRIDVQFEHVSESKRRITIS